MLLGLHQAIDLLIVATSFYIAIQLKTHFLPEKFIGLVSDYAYHLTFIIALISFHLSLKLFGCYNQYRDQNRYQIVLRVCQAALTGMMGIVFISYLIHMDGVSRLLLAIFTVLTVIMLLTFKISLFNTLAFHRKRNYNTKNILIIGSRQRAIDFIKAVLSTPESGYKILGCLETKDTKNVVGNIVYKDVTIIGTLESFKSILKEVTVDEVVFGIPLKKIDDVHDYIYYAESMGINVKIVPDFQIDKIKYLPKTATTSLHNFMGIPTLGLSSLPSRENELIVKYFIDYLGAGIGFLLLSPLLLIISIIIKLTSKGPVVFSQKRVGVNGRLFDIYKFRTMVENAEELKETLSEKNEVDGPVFKIKKDPRITKIGSILRKTSLDELPQLINVLKGEMSLVGPRPPVPSEVNLYELWQRRRLSMKPGLTCIWQVSGRNNISFEQWMNMDLEYIDNWSLWLDIKLLVKTIKEVTVGGGH